MFGQAFDFHGVQQAIKTRKKLKIDKTDLKPTPTNLQTSYMQFWYVLCQFKVFEYFQFLIYGRKKTLSLY